MRTLNRALIAALGVVLLAGALLAAVEIAIAFVGRGPWVVPYDDWYRDARAHDWQNGTARAIFILVAAAGILLLVIAFARRRPTDVALKSDGATYTLRRRTLEQSLARGVERVDGVASAAVKFDRRAVRVNARSNRQLPGDVKPSIQALVEGRLRDFELEHQPPVHINLRLRSGPS